MEKEILRRRIMQNAEAAVAERNKKLPTKTFGSLLKEYRKNRGINQAELAHKAKVSSSYINMLERDNQNPPRSQRMNKIFDALDLKGIERKRMRHAAAGLLNEWDELTLRTDPEDIPDEIKNYSTIWIVGNRPLEFDPKNNEELYQAIEYSISEGSRFVYWISEKSKDKFDKLQRKLEKNLSEKTSKEKAINNLRNSLECIICPDILCLHQSVIYDPYIKQKRKGIYCLIDENNIGIGSINLPHDDTEELITHLNTVQANLKTKQSAVMEEEGKYIRHYPK